MPNISVSYEEINNVSTKLTQVASETVPTLASLQTEVVNLLEPSGGLWLQMSSPVLRSKYQDFNTSVTQAVNNIPMWANQFQNIASSIRDLDQQISDSSRG